MVFSTIKASDASDIFAIAEVSEAILYNTESIRAIIDRVPEDDKGDGFKIPSVYFQVLKSDVSSVARTDTILYSGDTYSKPRVVEETDVSWIVEMVLDA